MLFKNIINGMNNEIHNFNWGKDNPQSFSRCFKSSFEEFIIQSNNNEISLADITRKFMKELHANEIVLLSYYIAAINIESTFDEINGDSIHLLF